MTPDHDPSPWPSFVVGAAALVGLFVLAITALTGCSTSTRYAAAQITWSAARVADRTSAREYRDLCANAGTYSSAETNECRERLRHLTYLVPIDREGARYLSLARITRVVRDSAAAAVIGLWAAEEGEPPRDLRERLSCVGVALVALVHAYEELDLPVPVVVEQAVTAVLSFGAAARPLVLGECPGVDDVTTSPPRGETPAPAPARDGGTWIPTTADAGTRDPWSDGGVQ